MSEFVKEISYFLQHELHCTTVVVFEPRGETARKFSSVQTSQ